jgi:hypothetical protein
MPLALALWLLPAIILTACAPLAHHADRARLNALTAQNAANFFRYRCANDHPFRIRHALACRRPDFERH